MDMKDVNSYSAMLSLYEKAVAASGAAEPYVTKAEAVLKEMEARKVERSVISYCAMLSLYVKAVAAAPARLLVLVDGVERGGALAQRLHEGLACRRLLEFGPLPRA